MAHEKKDTDSKSASAAWAGTVRPREKGVALLMATLSLLMLVPLAGLAIDAGMAYIIKTRLSVAVDSACLAAARSLNRGLDLASQRDAARGVALRYFNANFPTDHFGTTGIAPLVDIDESQSRLRVVTVNATRRAPLYFMPILGEHYADVSVRGQATRRDSNIILVLDRSSSMNTTSSMPPMRTAAKSFVDRFSNGRDRLGLVVYQHASFRAEEPTLQLQVCRSHRSHLDRFHERRRQHRHHWRAKCSLFHAADDQRSGCS
ncbi:MAG: pilus assembly protein TadG-related protein [Bryobacterales bacterium]|nr:pilus assembly protein TadG-related protein [Bryobacterales bacterium]